MSKRNKRIMRLAKHTLIILIVSVLLIGMVACNKKGPQKSGIIADDHELVIKGKVVFTISNESGTEEEAAAPNAFARAFEQKYPGVEVEIDDTKRNDYPARISTGDIGDVFWCDENDVNNYRKSHNAVMMLDYYLTRLGIDTQNVFSGALRSGMIDGRLYMVPRNLGQQVLIYNKDALREASIQMPEGGEAVSWEEFKNIAQQVTKEENGQYTQVGVDLFTWWGPIWQAFAEGWGGTWVNTVEKKVSFVSDENVMKGFSEMFDACTKGWMRDTAISYTGDLGQRYKGLTELDYVFKTFGDMQWITRLGNAYDQAQIDWDFCSFPAFPTHKVGTGATGYVVYNRTRNVDTAAALALFFLTEEGQRAYHSAPGGNVPLLKSLANEDFWRFPTSTKGWNEKNFDAFVSYPDASTPASVIARAPAEIADILDGDKLKVEFGKIINGTASMEDVFTKLETRCNETWRKLNDF